MFAPLHEGDDYLTLLARLHRALEPRNYLEIGVRRGDSLALATCPVIGIDPAMAPKREVFREKPSVFLFPLTSDYDVWKLVPILRRHRPDLRMCLVNAPPTGLVMITGLDPSNVLLRNNYDAILDEFGSLDLGTIGVAAHLASLPVQDTRTIFCTPETIRASFPAASKGKQAYRS